MKHQERNWKNYSIFLVYSNFFIILASFASLNRLNGNPIDFPFRIYLEHMIAGIGMPLVFAILIFAFIIIFKKNISKKTEKNVLLLWTIFWTAFETRYQFFSKPNQDSLPQMLAFILGIILLWILYHSLLYRRNN